MRRDWGFIVTVTVFVVVFAGLMTLAGWWAWRDQSEKDACVASHGQIVAPDHGDGWSCVHR